MQACTFILKIIDFGALKLKKITYIPEITVDQDNWYLVVVTDVIKYWHLRAF